MRCFVGNDIMREAAVDHLAIGIREIAEDKRFVLGTVKCVRVGKRMGNNFQLVAIESPADASTERLLEMSQGPHDNAVHILRVEVRVFSKLRVVLSLFVKVYVRTGLV